jgi:nucleoprotein TPR
MNRFKFLILQGVSESGLEVEYQVPTSSQRDQEDDAIVLSSDDEDDDDDEAMPDEGNAEAFEGEGIETDYAYEMERQELDEGPDIDDIQSANNEVEIEDISEVPNQSSADTAVGQSSQSGETSGTRQAENQQYQQIQSISSGSGNGNGNEEAGPSTSGANLSPSATSQWRQSPNASSRQQAQHLMLMSQTFQDEASDDRIVPSTPTLYRSRGDGFSEVVSSPHPAQVPHAAARFTFGESSSSSSSTRPMVEGMDETRIDLSEEQIAGGRNVPIMPQQQLLGDNLINDSTSASTSSTSSSISTVIQQDIQQEQPVAGSSSQEESQVPEISITGADDGELNQSLVK